MQIEIKVPVMGESISEATVSSFLVDSGSFVTSGQEILELETDKVNQVLYAPENGEITFNVAIDDVVKVGQKVASLKKGQGTPQPPQEKENKPIAPPPPKQETGVRKDETDFVKGLEEKKEVKPVKQETKTRKRMSGLRKTIASKLVEVKNKTAMLTTFTEIDMTEVMAIRSKEKENFEKQYGVKLGFMSFFVKAACAALKAYPQVNSLIEEDEIVTFHSYDIGVAVSTEKGLFVPVIRGCDESSFSEIEKNIAEKAKKAKEGTIAIDDLKGGSFTITNGGVFGSLLSTPILNPPQSAILGMHAIVKRPVAIDDKVEIRPMMYLALSYDHRIVDGRDAVLFLIHIKKSLEEPARLLLDL
jgi:2-oxoglutarate dehydrogenase E2 component (dihydrolipoamide succinyltransferase)